MKYYETSDFSVDTHTGIRYPIDMKTTPACPKCEERDLLLEALKRLWLAVKKYDRIGFDGSELLEAMSDARKAVSAVELKTVFEWLEMNGWDKLDGPEFNDWLKANGIDRRTLMIGRCRMPEGA